MNWAKKLLQKDDASLPLPSHDCPRCGGRLEDLGDGQVSCDTCSYPEPEEDERIVCDVCGRIIDDDGEYPTCPVCGVALCGDKECADEHIANYHPEWSDEDDEPSGRCDDCERDGDCNGCPGHPSPTADATEAAQEDMPFTPVKPMTASDQDFLASSFYKVSCRAAFVDAFGYRYALFLSDGQEVWPTEDGSLWVLTNSLQWVKLVANWRANTPCS